MVAVAPDSAAAPPVVDTPAAGNPSSPSKRNKAPSTAVVASPVPVVTVAPTVEPTPKKKANIANAVNIQEEMELEEESDQQSDELDSSEDSQGRSETLESESKEDKAVHVEVAAQGGDNHGNMSKSVVSYTHICNLFYVIVIVM